MTVHQGFKLVISWDMQDARYETVDGWFLLIFLLWLNKLGDVQVLHICESCVRCQRGVEEHQHLRHCLKVLLYLHLALLVAHFASELSLN